MYGSILGSFILGIAENFGIWYLPSGYKDAIAFVILFLFLFSGSRPVETHEPILTHNSSKDAVWCKEDPYGDEKCVILKFGGVLP